MYLSLWPILIYYWGYQIWHWIISGLWFYSIFQLCVASHQSKTTDEHQPRSLKVFSSFFLTVPQLWWVGKFPKNYDLRRHTVRLYFIGLWDQWRYCTPIWPDRFVMINWATAVLDSSTSSLRGSTPDHIQLVTVQEGQVLLVCEGLKFLIFLRSLLSRKK